MDHTFNHTDEAEYTHSNVKLWNPKGFIFIGVIFSFLPVAVLSSLNYGKLGLKKERNYNLFVFGALFVLLIAMSSFIQSNIAKAVFYGFNIALSSYMSNKQLELFKKHIERGGKKSSYVIPVVICLIITGLLIWAIIYSIHIPDKSLKIDDDEIFYTERITDAEVKEIGRFLKRAELFGNDNLAISVGIDRDKESYIFSLVVIDEAVNDLELAEYMKYLGNEMSQEVLNNQPVKVKLRDGRFQVIKDIQ
jgi:hypothetical protein